MFSFAVEIMPELLNNYVLLVFKPSLVFRFGQSEQISSFTVLFSVYLISDYRDTIYKCSSSYLDITDNEAAHTCLYNYRQMYRGRRRMIMMGAKMTRSTSAVRNIK